MAQSKSESQTQPVAKAELRFALVDALRGIAALVVVLFHAVEGGHIPALEVAMPDWIRSTLRHGNLGVAIFFVLSGFVISHSLYSVRVNSLLATRFMLRRSIRLDPPYWAAIVIAIVFAALSSVMVPGKSAPEIGWMQILAHVLYLQDILGYSSLNAVFWTLSLEVQFYLLYVAALALGRNDPDLPYQGKVVPFTLTVAMLVSLLWPMQVITTGLWSGSFLPLWHGFLIGVLAYWSWRQRVMVPIFFLTIAALFCLTKGNLFSIVCAITACTLWTAAVTKKLARALSWRWLQFLGLISYSLYLIHNPVTGASFRVGYMLTGHQLWSEAFWWSASVVICILFAWILWYVVERPSISLARRLRLRPTPSMEPKPAMLKTP